MIFLDELNPLRLYTTKFCLPIIEKNKLKNSAVFLLTPDYKSSDKFLHHKLLNHKYFQSYYIEKSINYIINKENNIDLNSDLDYSILNESSDINDLNKKIGLNDDGWTKESTANFYEILKSELEKENNNKDNKSLDECTNEEIVNALSKHIDGLETQEDRNKAIDELNKMEKENNLTEGINVSNILSDKNNPSKLSLYDKIFVYLRGFGYTTINGDNFYGNADLKILKLAVHRYCNNKKDLYTCRKAAYIFLRGLDVAKRHKKDTRKIDELKVEVKKLLKEMDKKEKLMRESVTASTELLKVDGINTINEITDTYLETDIDGIKSIIVFNEALDEEILNESTDYNSIIRKIIYNERYKNNKEIFDIYDKIKESNPWILHSFINYKRYKELNLLIDLSFYNNLFFKNNIYKMDKGVELYFEYINRFIKDKRIDKAGYTQKTVMIPILDWDNPEYRIYNFSKELNPISIIYRMMEKHLDKLKSEWKDIEFVFYSDTGYFSIDFNQFEKGQRSIFKSLLDRLINKDFVPDVEEDNKDSKKAIITNIVDKIEDSQGIKINNLTGNSENIDKNKLIKTIDKAATISNTTDDAIDNIDKKEKEGNDEEDEFKAILMELKDQENNTVKLNAVRNARISKLQDKFLNMKLKDTTIKSLLEEKDNSKPLSKTSLKLDTVNEEWQDLSFPNFNDDYNLDEDIMKILYSFSKKSVPVAIRDINIEDTSTSEDYIDTYTVKCEDGMGKRFTLKFDVPKLIDNRFLRLRGNDKTINNQEMLLPIEKTDLDTVQIVSNYNKIFIRRFGSGSGRSCMDADLLLKAIKKYDGKELIITNGDNSKICSKYELPIDYIDISSSISTIEAKQFKFYFNQDEIREKYKDIIDLSKGIPIGYDKLAKTIIYYNGIGFLSSEITNYLFIDNKFREIFNSMKRGKRYTYSKASILSSEIPVIVIMGFNEGLIKAMNKADIEYELSEKRHSLDLRTDVIKFKDGYLYYKIDYNSSLLMNGLKECNTEDYSVGDINNKKMYLDFLDIFGKRLLSDGLDNFYDLMIDPITNEVLVDYKLPTDYVSLLAYSNQLLSDNKYIKHTYMGGKRFRSNEVIAGYLYQALAKSYEDYRNSLRRNRSGSTMTIKQSAVIDAILLDPTASDKSELNALLDIENINAISPKGLSGMNNDRSYSLDKRAYDKSMMGLLGLSTGFAGNVGITRQAVIDMNITNKRGYLKIDEDPKHLSITKAFTASEALTPFGVTHDDPFRSAMTFIQTTKHGMRTKKSCPMLISNGMDQALPYLTSNSFAFKSKKNGKVIEKTNDYLIVEYDDKTHDFVDLRETVKKNSDGGFYITLKLDSDLKVGNKIKKNQILAYDKYSFDDRIGMTKDIAYNTGLLTKIAILNTDEGYEDSAIGSTYLSEAMASDIVSMRPVLLDKNTNIYNMVKVGDHIEEGDPLVIFQNSFEDNDVNILLKNLVDDEKEISDLGRVPIRSEVTGEIQDIKIYRTAEKEELSDSIKKVVNEQEKVANKYTKLLEKYDVEFKNRFKIDTLDTTGKLKKAENSVLIEFYIKHNDKLSIGDKIIYYSALKGVLKDIFPEGEEPYSDSRPNEKIHSLLSLGSISARMVCSIKLVVALNKLLIELDRYVKDKAGIPWKNLDEII